jgi:hypothetical protein
MLKIGFLQIANAWALLPLLALPIIYLVSKLIPPKPKTIHFPALMFLKGLDAKSSNMQTAPLWVKILRIIAIFALVFGLSAPFISSSPVKIANDKKILIIIDDGWSNAARFEEIKSKATEIIKSYAPLGTENTQFSVLISSAPNNEQIIAQQSQDALDFIKKLEPKAYIPSHEANFAKIFALKDSFAIYYFSDGLKHNSSDEMLENLAKIAIGKFHIDLPANKIAALSEIKQNADGFAYQYKSIGRPKDIEVEFLSKDGEIFASSHGSNGHGSVILPDNLSRRVAFAKIRGENTAGGTYILNATNLRPLIGIENLNQTEEPLISDKYYIKTAAKMLGDVVEGEIDRILPSRPNAIIIGDRSGFSPNDERTLLSYMRGGGTIIRFIGPLALGKENDPIITGALAHAPKIMAGSFSWNNAQIAPSEAESPLFGMETNNDARPRLVAVFESPPQNTEIWARLQDKTPFISRKKIGEGQLVMIHTTASPAWSEIAFSATQIQFLRRILQTSQAQGIDANTRPPNAPMYGQTILNAYGEIGQIAPDAKPILPKDTLPKISNQEYNPGIYSGGGSILFLQAANQDLNLSPINLQNIRFETMNNIQNNLFLLRPYFLVFGFLALLLDSLIAIMGADIFNRFKKPATTNIILLALIVLPFLPLQAKAQAINDDMAMAYILTPDQRTNAKAKAGLEGLAQALNARTNVHSSRVVGIDPSKDELALYPIIYWLLPDNITPANLATNRALNAYMQNGGILFIDTKGAGRDANNARALTQSALRGLVVPPLEQVPQGHVLGRSFYLLMGFPGRFANSKLWVANSASMNASANDGVSPIIIGDGDWAAAWAGGPHDTAQAAIEGGDLRRETAFRVGINIYIYALTGQYKADQIHVPAILNRLGQPQSKGKQK